MPPGTPVTPNARDRARELGLALISGPAPSGDGTDPTAAATAPAAPAPVRRPAPAAMPLRGYGMTPETEGYAHPLHAPLYFRRQGQRALDHKNLLVKFRADPAVLAEFVPEPLELASDVVTANLSEHYQPGHSLPVLAAGVSVRASFGDIEGSHMILAICPSDEVICANREELGMPLIHGEARLWSKGNTWFGFGKRGGREIIQISVFPERAVSPEEAGVLGSRGPLVLFKKIPSADPNRKPWRQVLAIEAERTGPLIEVSMGRGAVDLSSSVWRLHRIKPLEVIGGFYYHFDGLLLKQIECLWEDRPEPVP